jgi:hypothetical protein
VLLTATLRGKLTAWTQQPPEPNAQTRYTIEDWWPHDVADLGASTAAAAAAAAQLEEAAAEQSSVAYRQNSSPDNLLAVQWLQPASPWVWNSSAVQQADYQSGSMHDMFAHPSLAGAAGTAVSCKPDPAGDGEAAAGTPGAADGAAAAAGGDQLSSSGSSTEEFHWVRPGTLAVAAVMSSGAVVVAWAQWSAYGQLSWVCTSGMSLPTPAGLAGKMQVAIADAAVCAEGVAFAYTLQQQSNTVFVAQLHGNPLHVQCALLEPGSQPLQLPVVQAGAFAIAQPECCITALSWDQSNSNSNRLACVAANRSNGASAAADAAAAGSSSGATVVLLSVQQGQLQQQAQVQCAAAVSQQQVVWLPDGLLLWSGGDSMQLFTVDPLQEAPVTFASPAARLRAAAAANEGGRGSRVLRALAASPHGVAVAAVMTSSSSAASGISNSRLLLFNVPPAAQAVNNSSSSSGEVGFSVHKAAAARLLWALMQQKHTWDVVQHTLCAARLPASNTPADASSTAAAAGAIQPEVVGQVLSLVDSKLGVQQATLKSTFSARWDVLKLAVLTGTPGDVARVVGIDLRLRIISHMMKPVWDVMREVCAVRVIATAQLTKNSVVYEKLC